VYSSGVEVIFPLQKSFPDPYLTVVVVIHIHAVSNYWQVSLFLGKECLHRWVKAIFFPLLILTKYISWRERLMRFDLKWMIHRINFRPSTLYHWNRRFSEIWPCVYVQFYSIFWKHVTPHGLSFSKPISRGKGPTLKFITSWSAGRTRVCVSLELVYLGHWFFCVASVHRACRRAEAWHAWHASVIYKIQIMSKFRSLLALYTYEPTIIATT